ncbi:MAG: homogentisate phytyltransferase [Oscillatoria sp. SIO1A7]|nr:homogentisate phytyltransferase [Oscillatoria sp. SIO1A7]
MPNLRSLWKFSRPHTVVGTSLSVLGLYLVAIAFANLEQFPPLLPLLGTWIACLSANIYIVGLNQLEDIEIDKINKPHLPLAAGEFSYRQGQAIVAITGILGAILAIVQGPWLLATVAVSLALGTAYSLPPVRLKRFPFWASFCIFAVRGVVVNVGLFLHSAWVLGNSSPGLPPAVVGLTLFILGFAFAIAIFKDIPDLEGDKQYGIATFTIKLGTGAVFNFALRVLTACYLATVVAGSLGLPGVNPVFLTMSHLLVMASLWWRSAEVDLENKKAIASCYQFIWKLFFLEYLIFPAACLFN